MDGCDICILKNLLNSDEILKSSHHFICIQCSGAMATKISWAFKDKEDFEFFGNLFKKISSGKCDICTNENSIVIEMDLCHFHEKSILYYEEVKKHQKNMKYSCRRNSHVNF